jgi:hypothetical protein
MVVDGRREMEAIYPQTCNALVHVSLLGRARGLILYLTVVGCFVRNWHAAR